jgi:hypothetical protein
MLKWVNSAIRCHRRIAPFGRFWQALTRLDTPPSSDRHHPHSTIALPNRELTYPSQTVIIEILGILFQQVCEWQRHILTSAARRFFPISALIGRERIKPNRPVILARHLNRTAMKAYPWLKQERRIQTQQPVSP